MLDLHFVYVLLSEQYGQRQHEVIFTREGALSPERVREAREHLAPWVQNASSQQAQSVASPLGEGSVRLSVSPLGKAGECGVLAAASGRLDFPTEVERLLLGVAVNQAAVAVQQEAGRALARGPARVASHHAFEHRRRCGRRRRSGARDVLEQRGQYLTGWSAAEALGRDLPEVFHAINEQTRQPVENPALTALRGGTIVGLASQPVLVARDGQERPIDDCAAPMRDKSGALVGAVLVFRDLSERRRAEEVRSLLAAIVESSEDAIVSKTLDGRILSWNAGAERLFGYTRQEAIGQPITLIIPPERQDEERSILERLRRGERVEHFETVRLSKAGQRIDISLSISPVRDGAGRIVGASKVAATSPLGNRPMRSWSCNPSDSDCCGRRRRCS